MLNHKMGGVVKTVFILQEGAPHDFKDPCAAAVIIIIIILLVHLAG